MQARWQRILRGGSVFWLVILVSRGAWANPRLHAPLSPSGSLPVQISDALLYETRPCIFRDGCFNPANTQRLQDTGVRYIWG
jgi:hypothetical protein